MTPHYRRDVLKTIGGAGVLLAAGTTTAAASPGRRQGASGDSTIVDIAESAGLEVLTAAVVEADLVDLLSGNRQLTVFAPTDEAFNAAGITAGNVDDVDDDFLLNVLSYHVTSGRRYARSVVNPAPVEMLNGDSVTTDGTTLNGDQADIVATDIEANNGVVHVIDGVLLP